jgi:ComF family protein
MSREIAGEVEAGMGRQYIEPAMFSRLSGLAATVSDRIADALPSQCAVCRDWQDARICSACVAAHARRVPRCLLCAIEVPVSVSVCGACVKEPPPFERCIAAVDHDHPWRALVAAMKFRASLDLIAPLGQRLLLAVNEACAPRVDLIIPTPLAEARLNERGYNQAWELARWLGARLALPARADLVGRWRDTPHQLGLDPAQRHANVRGAFAVEATKASALRGQRVAIVDDVMTTGATLTELARCLRDAGASSVQAWVLARTPKA